MKDRGVRLRLKGLRAWNENEEGKAKVKKGLRAWNLKCFQS